MSYANMDHADWVRRNNGGRSISPLGEKVANILGIVGGGIYNAPLNVKKVEWSNERFIEVKWRGELATFDFSKLTYLVVICHEAKIRVSLEGCGPGYMRMFFTQRQAEGSTPQRHPSIEEAVADVRSYLGPDHPLLYRVFALAQPTVRQAAE